ncbi:hypothetical protein BGZ68_001521 [Mortierella alpina]|nr:hypothetical protein BGZ68_001521 [Mortierella alpina]
MQQLHQRQQHLQHEQQQGELRRLQHKQQKELQRKLEEQQQLVQRKTQLLQWYQRSEWIQRLETKQQTEVQRLLKKQGQDQQEHHEQQHQLQLEQLQKKHQRQRQWRQKYELKMNQQEVKSFQELQLYHQQDLQNLQQRELFQELSLTPAEDDLKKLVADFESKAQARSRSKDECFELYTTRISQIQGWIVSRKIQYQSAQLLSPPCRKEDVNSAPPSPPTFHQLIPRFVNSYRMSVVSAPRSDTPWDKDSVDDEQLLVQFLKRLPSDSLRVFSHNKFSFRNRALLELLVSSAEHLPGLSCLSMYRNDASEVNTQLITSDWGQQDPLGADPFTAEIDWFLDNCPLQLRTLRIAIAGFLEPMHGRLTGQRNRANKNKTPMQRTRTAIQHLYLEGEIAISSQPEFLERCPDLRSVSISCTKQYPALYLAPMIEHCPKLENLAISCPSRGGEDMTESIVAFIRGCAPSPTSPSSLASASTTAMGNVRMGLKRLRLENLLASQDSVIGALQLCARTLTHLAIRDCRLPMVFNPQSGTDTFGATASFNRILETFTQLQELDLMSTPTSIHQDPNTPRNAMLHGKFDAQHLVDIRPLARNDSTINMSWACSKSLKVLRVEIRGIHRAPPSRAKLPDSHKDLSTTADSSFPSPASFPTVTAAAQRELEGPDPEQIKEGHRLQWEVCLLLGTLSSLEELCLGTLNVPGDDRPPALPALSQWRGGSYRMAAGIQTQCLELTLSTGLELLGGMKEMRVLKVGGLEHRIGLGEIQWMCEHWPKLEAVYGLLRVKNREQYDPDWEGKEEDKEMERKMVKWIRKNRPYLRYT